jgi:hypothetical protein
VLPVGTDAKLRPIGIAEQHIAGMSGGWVCARQQVVMKLPMTMADKRRVT